MTWRTAISTTRFSTGGMPSGLSSWLPSFGNPYPFDGLWLIGPSLELFLQGWQPLVLLLGIPPAASAVGFLLALMAGHSGHSTLQVFHLPYFVHQAIPFASFDSSFEGCQHTLGPHTGFGPRPFGGYLSALFSLWHSRQVLLLVCVLHVSPFLPPLAPRSLLASSLLWGL